MKRLLHIALLSLLTAAPAMAQQEEEMVFDFSVESNFDSCTQWSPSYDREGDAAWNYSSYSNYAYMYNYSITDGYYDDSIITPDLALESGKLYVIYTTPTAYSSTNAGKSALTVSLGQGDNYESYKQIGKIEKLPYQGYDSTVESHEILFTVEESGNYRVAFNAGPYAIYMKETCIKSRGTSEIPKAPSDFKVTPDPDGALSVTVSFTMPSTTITGQTLVSPVYNLYRGFQKIKNGISATPGEQVVISETRGESGNISYSVEIVCGEAVSEKITAESYIGPETPLSPTDAQLAINGSQYTVSWAAPTTGVHGVTLVPEKLSYDVIRVLDGEETTVTSGLTGTSFTEELTPDGLQMLYYKVTASYGTAAMKSESASTSFVKIGTTTLPFADSFAGAVINPMWDNVLLVGDDFPRNYWQPKDKMESRTLTCDPYDGDGGLLFYDSYMIKNGYSARLSTPPIKYEQGDDVVLSFAMFHIASGTDEMKVQVSSDYGEWVDVPEAVFTPKGEPADAWTVHTVRIAPSIAEGAESFRVGLLGVSQYGQSVVIDDVKVIKLAEKDLGISKIDVTPDLNAGQTATLTVKVDNNSAQAIPVSDYTLDIISDFPGEPAISELVDVPAMSSVFYTLEIPVTSGHIVNGSDFRFAVRVNCEGDTDDTNDESAAASMTVGYSNGAPATNLVHSSDTDGVHVIEWESAKDLDYVPVSITESFEDEALADTPTGPFNGWTQVDLDGSAGDNWYTASGCEFKFIANANTPSGLDGKNCLGVTVASNKQQDDWIISPEINCKQGSTMNLNMLMGTKKVSSYGNEYVVTLMYSTDSEFDILNPQNAFTQSVGFVKSANTSDVTLPQDNKMHEISFTGIPAEARRVALHFTTKGQYSPAMWIDNIRLVENDECPLLGYRVYAVEDGRCLTDEMIGADATSHTLSAAARDTQSTLGEVFVSAVYPDGEAEPSNIVNLSTPASVEGLTAEPADSASELYDLNGLRISGNNPAPGIYIRRTAAGTEKVIIR